VKARAVAESARAIDELRESEALFKTLLSKSMDGLFVVQDEHLIYANNVFAEILGYNSPEELIGKPISETIAAESLEITREIHRRRVKGEQAPEEYETTMLHKDGKTGIPVRMNATAITYKGRRSSLGTIRDLTALKAADTALRYNEALLGAMASDNPLGMYVVDFRSDKILFANQRFIDLWRLGHLTSGILSGSLKDVNVLPHLVSMVKDTHSYKENRSLLRELANRTTTDDILELRDGRWLRRISSQIRDDSDQYFGRMFLFEDITYRVKAEQQLREAKEMAELSEHLKDAFIGNMSHEIRTPLNIIIGYTELLKAEIANATGKDHGRVFENIASAGARLVRTIEHIMNISSIQAGAFPLHQVDLELSEFVRMVANRFRDKAIKKGIEFKVERPPEPVYIHVDKYCVEQALMNVIDNAVKFTRRGAIRIEIKTANGFGAVQIHDTGIGIGMDYLPRLFEPFSQETTGIDRSYEGLGLGMILTKHYLEMNKGKLDIWSNKGTGTTVTLNFPAAVSGEPVIELPQPEYESALSKKDHCVLVVEDDETTQEFLRLLLSQKFCTVFAESADEALRVLRSQQVQLILMDLSLSGDIDGIELTRHIRHDPTFCTIPVIVTTAHAHADTRQLSFEAGCNEFLTKPLDVVNLPILIEQHIRKKLQHDASAA